VPNRLHLQRCPNSSFKAAAILGWGLLASTPFIGLGRHNFSDFLQAQFFAVLFDFDSVCPRIVQTMAQNAAIAV
jgi:hypothetical protein